MVVTMFHLSIIFCTLHNTYCNMQILERHWIFTTSLLSSSVTLRYMSILKETLNVSYQLPSIHNLQHLMCHLMILVESTKKVKCQISRSASPKALTLHVLPTNTRQYLGNHEMPIIMLHTSITSSALCYMLMQINTHMKLSNISHHAFFVHKLHTTHVALIYMLVPTKQSLDHTCNQTPWIHKL